MTEDSRESLMKITKELLIETKDVDSITTRTISSKANVNLALINYYFGSKDELLKAAANEIIESSSENMYGFEDDSDPKECIVNFFRAISADMVKYRKFTKLYIPDILLKDEITIPNRILPIVRRYFGNRRTESECRLAAYRMVSEAQLIFYRSDDLGKYIGKEISDDYETIIRTIVDDILR